MDEDEPSSEFLSPNCLKIYCTHLHLMARQMSRPENPYQFCSEICRNSAGVGIDHTHVDIC